jgi:PAS domain S-box-containing protein
MNDFSKGSTSDEQEAAITAARFKALVTATSDVTYCLSADWRVMQVLDGRGFLKDTQEPISDWQSKYIYPEDRAVVTAAIEQAILTKTLFELEHRIVQFDGMPGWTFSRAVPILDDQGEIVEWFGIASDITGRKHVQEQLSALKSKSDQQRRLYETITSNTPDLMYVFDLNYRFIYANTALLSMWGKTWEAAIGKGLLENGYEPWHAQMHEREIDRIIKFKQPIRGEVSFPHAMLGRRVYDYILTPVLNEHGEVEAIAGTTRDVTERKQWEESLTDSSKELQAINEEMAATNEELAASNEELFATNEELAQVNQELVIAQQKIEEGQVAFRLAVNAANFGTWMIHSITREFITDVRLKELFGYYPEESLSIEQALAQITDEYRVYVTTKLENAIYNNGDYDVTYPVIGLHDNRLRWLRAIGNLKADPSGTFSAFTGVVMDITEQQLAASEIKRAEENLRMAVEAAGLGTFYLHVETGDFGASPKLKELFGFGANEDISYDVLINHIQQDYRKEVVNLVRGAFISEGRFETEFPVTSHHDGSVRWVRSIGEMQHNKSGDYFAGVIHDITEQKLNEIRKNDFIGMVSHELKTPLTSMKGYVQLMQMRLKNHQDELIVAALDKANYQVTKMTTMINGFLNISRLESGRIHIEHQTFDLAMLLKEVQEETLAAISSHKIIFDPIQSISVRADWDKIGQVIHNLISNAVKYSPQGSIINVACTAADGTASVIVKDQGMGIRPDNITNIFTRYFRVEGQHMRSTSGFGIGLYLCAEIIERHHGKIWAESKFGKGSTFIFCLPMYT